VLDDLGEFGESLSAGAIGRAARWDDRTDDLKVVSVGKVAEDFVVGYEDPVADIDGRQGLGDLCIERLGR